MINVNFTIVIKIKISPKKIYSNYILLAFLIFDFIFNCKGNSEI